ncbi:MAG: 1A family penicillin-binding protein [Parcubacteria group bacterium Gr01-1014_3]|nr:MAG: 1A family penicillin-binding protein [Parcubacteria group bacterium Gr01-1014_3]
MRKIVIYGGGAIFGFFLIGVISFFVITSDLPGPEILSSRQVSESTKIYDRTGEVLLYEIHGEEKRTLVPLEKIPEVVKQATIAIEDVNFYNHGAFDLKALLRAVYSNLTDGYGSQGGSTITQQLAKKAFLSDEKKLTRKIRELVLAIRLEKEFTKDEILTLYLNQIPYGSNAYGIQAAAQTYFSKNVEALTLPEAAILASLPQAPSYYSPWGANYQELLDRKDTVLEKMFQLGYIDEKTKDQAIKQKLNFSSRSVGIKAPHFVVAVQDYLNEKYGEGFVQTAGLKVITTLDWTLQQIAERVVYDGAKRNEELYAGKNAALVAQDATTGQILAMVGSRDYFEEGVGNFNVATQGLRQPGSTIKPFAYLAAFKKGFTPDTMVFDLETEFDATGDPEKSYKPQNFDEIFRGPVTLRQALGQSINIPSIKTLYLAGIDNLLKLLKTFGVTTLTERSRYGLSLVLGGGEMKLNEIVGAYSVFAQEGIYHKQAMVLSVAQNGKMLEQYSDESEQVIESQYTRLITDILTDIDIRSGLFGGSLGLTMFPNHEVAMKTGTTNDYRDAWTIGYTPSFVVGVWAGNNDNAPMQKRGSSLLAAVPIWSAFLREALPTQPTTTFSRPDPIFTDKPMLNGQYIVNYSVAGQNYPQIHDLLYYVDKSDPLGPAPANPEEDSQFTNWEDPVIEWAKTHLPNFDTYNRPVPSNATAQVSEEIISNNIISPKNGSFLKNPLSVYAEIKTNLNIKTVEVYFNNQLIDRVLNVGKYYIYTKNLSLQNIELQNTLKILVLDELNNKSEKEIILYK